MAHEFHVGDRVRVSANWIPHNGHEGVITQWVDSGFYIVDNRYVHNPIELEYIGRALVPTASGNGGSVDDLAYHIKCAFVAALSEDKWRNDWTSEEAVNQLTFEIAALRQQVASLRAALAFYADANNYRMPLSGLTLGESAIEEDSGEQARKALGESDNGS